MKINSRKKQKKQEKKTREWKRRDLNIFIHTQNVLPNTDHCK